MNKTIRILIVCTFTLLSFNSNAKNILTTYYNSLDGTNYNIFLSSTGNGEFTLWINAMSNDNASGAGGIVVEEDNYYKFINALNLAKLKYLERIKEIEENRIQKPRKSFRIYNTADAYFTYFTRKLVYTHKDAELNYQFVVQEIEGKPIYLLIVNTGELTAINNTGIHSNGCSLVFSSATEIDKFIDQISIEKIDSFIVKNDTIGHIKKSRSIDGSWHPKSQSGFLSKMEIGIKAAYNTSLSMNNTNNQIPNTYSLKTATESSNIYNLGAFARINFNKFYLQPEILFSVGQRNYALTLFDNHMQTIDFNKTATINTLDIPLLFGYKIWNSKTTNFRVFAGPKLRLNAGSSVEHTIFQTYGTTNAKDLKTAITPTQWGLETGLGLDFSAFTLDVRYNLIEDMHHTQLNSHTIDNLSANALVVSLGWKIFRPKK